MQRIVGYYSFFFWGNAKPQYFFKMGEPKTRPKTLPLNLIREKGNGNLSPRDRHVKGENGFFRVLVR